MDTALFFPELGNAAARTEKARAVCAICPVRKACLDHSIEHGELGVWGGLTTSPRERLAGHRFRLHMTTDVQAGLKPIRTKCLGCHAQIVEGVGHECMATLTKGYCAECEKYSMKLDDDDLCPRCRMALNGLMVDEVSA